MDSRSSPPNLAHAGHCSGVCSECCIRIRMLEDQLRESQKHAMVSMHGRRALLPVFALADKHNRMHNVAVAVEKLFSDTNFSREHGMQPIAIIFAHSNPDTGVLLRSPDGMTLLGIEELYFTRDDPTQTEPSRVAGSRLPGFYPPLHTLLEHFKHEHPMAASMPPSTAMHAPVVMSQSVPSVPLAFTVPMAHAVGTHPPPAMLYPSMMPAVGSVFPSIEPTGAPAPHAPLISTQNGGEGMNASKSVEAASKAQHPPGQSTPAPAPSPAASPAPASAPVSTPAPAASPVGASAEGQPSRASPPAVVPHTNGGANISGEVTEPWTGGEPSKIQEQQQQRQGQGQGQGQEGPEKRAKEAEVPSGKRARTRTPRT